MGLPRALGLTPVHGALPRRHTQATTSRTVLNTWILPPPWRSFLRLSCTPGRAQLALPWAKLCSQTFGGGCHEREYRALTYNPRIHPTTRSIFKNQDTGPSPATRERVDRISKGSALMCERFYGRKAGSLPVSFAYSPSTRRPASINTITMGHD